MICHPRASEHSARVPGEFFRFAQVRDRVLAPAGPTGPVAPACNNRPEPAVSLRRRGGKSRPVRPWAAQPGRSRFSLGGGGPPSFAEGESMPDPDQPSAARAA